MMRAGNPMNIAFLMQDVGAMFGAERATLDLVAGLRKSGEQVHVLLIDEKRLGLGQSDLRDAFAAAGVPFTRLPTSHPFSPALVRKIRKAATDSSAQVVHAVGPKATLHAYLAMRNTEVRLFSTVHGWLFRRDPKERFYEWLERKVLKRFDRVIVLSSFYDQHLARNGFRRDQVVHVPSGLDVESVVTEAEARRTLAGVDPFTVGTIGRLSTEKNHVMFLRAARDIAGRGAKIRFIVAGEGPERSKLERLVEEWGLSGVVRMPGYLSAGDFMRQVSVLIQCSFIENLPYSAMEAMAWCRPVVATNVGGLPDLIDEGKTGFLVPSDDHEALANRICAMSSWPRLIEEMGLAGRRKLETGFSLRRSVERHRELYASVSG